MYLAAYWPLLPQMQQAMDRACSRRAGLSEEENERLARLVDHHEYTRHTVASMIYAGRILAGTAGGGDREALAESKTARSAATARIARYRPYYAQLIAALDADGHTRVLYGKKPTIEVRAPSDFNE